MRQLLNLVYLAIAIPLIPIWLWRIVVRGELRAVYKAKLFGRPPRLPDDDNIIWLHASSIGEVLLLVPLVKRLKSLRSDLQFVLSTYTFDGFEAARRVFPNIPVFYLPVDLSWRVRRMFGELNPRLVVLSELELWPNLLLEAKLRGVPVAVVNCLMNDPDLSFFKRIGRLQRPALASVKWWGAQTARDAERIREIVGDTLPAIDVTGSLKFDAALEMCGACSVERFRQDLGFSDQDRILVAGSTHAPEEELIMDAFLKLHREFPNLRLIIAPRDRERFGDVADLLRDRGALVARRSNGAWSGPPSEAVTLVDTVGELPSLWRIADIAFVGGSLVRHGGHNPLEPAASGTPLLFGPHMWNFESIAEGLIRAEGAQCVLDGEQMLRCIERWLRVPAEAAALGENAAAYVRSHQGATERTLMRLLQFIPARK